MATLKLKRSSTAGAVPTTGNLALGEVALNTEDGYLYAEKSGGTVVQRIGTTSDRVGYKPLGAATNTRTVEQKLREGLSLRDHGAKADNGSTDCSTALDAVIALGATTIRMEYVPGEANVAYFSTFDVNGALVGKTLDIDPRITVSVPDNQVTGVPNSAGVRHTRPTKYYMRGLNDYYTVHPEGGDLWYGNGARRSMPYLGPDDAELGFPVSITGPSLTPRKILWNTSDAWNTDSYSASDSKGFSFSLATDNNLHMGMAPCKPGDEFVCSFSTTGVPLIAALVRHTGGYAGVWSQADYNASTATFFQKNTGAAGTSSTLTFLGGGTHGSYSGLGGIWTIRIDSWKSASILLNGYAVARFSTSGYIFECGFGGYALGAGQTVNVTDIVRIRGGKYRGGEFCSVRIYGDSKTADRYDSWPTYFKDSLEFACGVRCWRVTNRAVAGQGISQQQALMAGDPVGDSNLVIIDIGTNDIQGLTSVSSFTASLGAMVDQALAAHCNVLLGVPSLWYTQGQAGARGQASSNYDRGAPYRSAILRLAADKGIKVVDNTRFDGPVLANYVNSALTPDLTAAGDSVVYDNIHPTTEANKRRALSYARAAASFYANKSGSLYLPPHAVGYALNGWQTTIQPPKATVSEGGVVRIYGVVDTTASPVRTDGTVIFQLPEYLIPKDTIRVPCVAQATADKVYVNVGTSGAIQVFGAATSGWVDLSGISFSIEDREVI